MLYVGEDPVEHAAAAVQEARTAGMRVAFVTNNASRTPSVVAAQLNSLDIPATDEEVVTSGQAAARVVAERVPAGSAVLVLGTQALVDEIVGAGLRAVRTVQEAGADDVAAVVQGLSPETCNADLGEAAVALRAGAVWVASNTDLTLPSRRGPMPGNGVFVVALQQITGLEPLVAGKPDPALHQASVQRVAGKRPLVIGDRLDTDVLGAVRGGADSLLVLTGVVDRPALLRAPAGSRPTYVAHDLRALARPQPEVVVDGDAARCGDAVARYADGVVTVTGDGDDALRAEAALAWACADADRPLNP